MAQDSILHRFQQGDRLFADDPTAALACYEAVLTEAPDHYMAHFNAAVLLSRLGYPERAIGHLDAACRSVHSEALGHEMQQVMWDTWGSSRGDAAFETFEEVESPAHGDFAASQGPSTLKVSGFFTANDMAQSAGRADDDTADANVGLFCPRCNGNIPSIEADFCPSCGFKRPQPPFSWYQDAMLGRTILDGRFTIDQKIDWSGFGVVYRATEVGGPPGALAVKVVNLEALADLGGLIGDLDKLSAAGHRTHVRTLLRGVLPGTDKFCVVSEYVDGKSLETVIEGREPLDVEVALPVLLELVRALKAAHAVGVHHLSLKPSNVFLLRRPQGLDGLDVKVLNLGNTLKVDPLANLGAASRIVGDPEYMAPEQLAPQGVADAATDLYQLGAVMFYALTGRPPYLRARLGTANDVLAAQQARKDQLGPSPVTVRPELAYKAGLGDLVARLLATDKARRPASITEVEQRLDAIIAGQPDDRASSLEANRPHDQEAMNTGPIRLAAIRRYNQAFKEVEDEVAAAERLTDPVGAANAWLRVARMYKDELQLPEKAAEAFHRALDLDCTLLQAFKELTLLHGEAQDWPGLQSAYERMIERLNAQASPNTGILAVLWQKLGELRRQHFNDPAMAAMAIRTALHHLPHSLPLQRLLADVLAEASDDDMASLREAIALLTRMLRANPRQIDLLERLGILYLRARQFDPALCVFRVLTHLGGGDARARQFVTAHTSPVVQPPRALLSADVLARHVFDEGHDVALAIIFALTSEALVELLGNDHASCGVHPRDEIALTEGVLFSRLYQTTCQLLCFAEPPLVFRKADLDGMRNGSLVPPGFLVGGGMLSGLGEKQVAAVIAKQLLLFQSPSYLIQTRSSTDLEVIFYTLAKVARPELAVQPTDDMRKVERALQRYRKAQPERWAHLERQILDILDRQREIALGELQDSFEDAGNRVALLFADDLDIVRHMLSLELQPIRPERRTQDRMDALLRWCIDPRYHELRRLAGKAVA